MTIDKLPKEALYKVLYYLHITDIHKISTLNKTLNRMCLQFRYDNPTSLPLTLKDECRTFYRIAHSRVKLTHRFTDVQQLNLILSSFENLKELEIHVRLTSEEKKALVQSINDSSDIKKLLVANKELPDWQKRSKRLKFCPLFRRDMEAILISSDGHLKYSTTISAFNKYVKASIALYEGGGKLSNEVETLALYNIAIIRPGSNDYEIQAGDWEQFKELVQGNIPHIEQLTEAEKEVISSSLNGTLSYHHLATMQSRLEASNSTKVPQILKVLENLNKMTDANVKEEDIVITNFIQPLLIDPFLRNIPGTSTHGNGYSIHESYVRKMKMVSKLGMPTKGIKGRVPDRHIVYNHPSNKKFSVLVVEAKTSNSSKTKPDLVKLGTLLKDILDFAINKGINNHSAVGMLIEGPCCKLFKMSMPIDRMYCMQEVCSFSVPDNIGDDRLQEKIENIISSMLLCRELVDEAIVTLQEDQESFDSSTNKIVDSYPSPAQHYLYYR